MGPADYFCNNLKLLLLFFFPVKFIHYIGHALAV